MDHDWRDFWKMVLMWAENQLISEIVANKAANFIQSGIAEDVKAPHMCFFLADGTVVFQYLFEESFVVVQLTDEETRTAEFNHDGTPGEKMAEIKAALETKEEDTDE